LSLRKGLIQALKFLAFLLVGVVLLWLAFRNIDFRSLSEGLKNARYSWLLLSLFFGLMAYFIRSRRWILLIHALGYKPSFRNTYHALMTGYLFNIALPRLGEITRCVALGKKEKIPVDQLFGTVIIERTIDLVSILIIMVVMIFFSGDQIGGFLNENVMIPLSEKIQSVFGFTWIIWVLLLAFSGLLLALIYIFRHSLRKVRLFAKILDLAKGVIDGLKTIIRMERKAEFLLHTVLLWLSYALMTWVVVFAIESTSHLTFADGIFLLVIGSLAMSAPVQSGLGVFHFIISRGLFFIDGIKLEDGLVYAILTHESQLIFVLIAGAISFFVISGFHSLNGKETV
jgi:uncharacterized protein (TIRG00374 family)